MSAKLKTPIYSQADRLGDRLVRPQGADPDRHATAARRLQSVPLPQKGAAMMPTAIPLKVGIYDRDDDGLELLAVVEVADAHSATVDINTAVNAPEWEKLAGVIGSALRAMGLQGDKP